MQTVLDIVIPVYNERATVAACVRRLREHLDATFPYPARITIADNASTDGTWQVVTELAATLPGVTAVHLEDKGRGRALKQAWLASDALILAYMDVDLSTDLDALWPLVAPLMSGHSDLAIGSRLDRGARVVRGVKREVISRGYNLILRAALGARFSDAQCGFKAIRADVARELLPLVEDAAWFFDTELLVLAERCLLRIHEVPVDWYDDPDSRVDLASTAAQDLRGVRRLRRTLRANPRVELLAVRIGRGRPETGVGAQAVRFLGIGVVSIVIQLALFVVLREGLTASAQWANTLALVGSTLINTALNRRWTFGVRGRAGVLRHQLQGLGIVAVTWCLTAVALWLLARTFPAAPTWVETGTVALATAVATVAKFGVMRTWVFRSGPSLAAGLAPEPPPAPASETSAALPSAGSPPPVPAGRGRELRDAAYR